MTCPLRVLVVPELLQEFPRGSLAEGQLDFAGRHDHRAPQRAQPFRVLQHSLNRVGQGPAQADA